jgi:hypothetical protein
MMATACHTCSASTLMYRNDCCRISSSCVGDAVSTRPAHTHTRTLTHALTQSREQQQQRQQRTHGPLRSATRARSRASCTASRGMPNTSSAVNIGASGTPSGSRTAPPAPAPTDIRQTCEKYIDQNLSYRCTVSRVAHAIIEEGAVAALSCLDQILKHGVSHCADGAWQLTRPHPHQVERWRPCLQRWCRSSLAQRGLALAHQQHQRGDASL